MPLLRPPHVDTDLLAQLSAVAPSLMMTGRWSELSPEDRQILEHFGHGNVQLIWAEEHLSAQVWRAWHIDAPRLIGLDRQGSPRAWANPSHGASLKLDLDGMIESEE